MTYWIRRILGALAVVFLVLTLNFVFFRLMPGDPLSSLIDPRFSPETKEALRHCVAYVSQQPYLFEGTIADNIRYGRPDATEEEIIEAAKLANAHEFIESMVDGYDTKLDERGSNLSGGQRQRLSIARALL